ncbi:MAG: pyruvate, phosphate dikinase [Thermoleophilia bacterium]|nr:pyruvate, phosphate dikinase [Thermoleophilia bacterium]
MSFPLVYGFAGDAPQHDIAGDRTRLLGGKGAHLAEMAGMGIPVPPGFTITTEVCSQFAETEGVYPAALDAQVEAALAQVEGALDMRLGDSAAPLLLSVRSGAPVSMPGMMDTVLNLGLNDATVEGLAVASGDARFAWDAYRRFIQMFADVVMGVHVEHFEGALHAARQAAGVEHDNELDADTLRALVTTYREIVREHAGIDVPTEPREQLWQAITAVFRSWSSDRAIVYRHHHDIADSLGTAVTVQAMVFGNAGDDCATGVAFTRNPATGERALYGEFLRNAQGEDVVAGIRTPQPITNAAALGDADVEVTTLETMMPGAYRQLADTCSQLELHYRDSQDVEFTVQHGQLWMLQTRSAKRTAAAAIQIAVDMVGEGLITQDEALLRVDASSLNQLLHPSFDPAAKVQVLATGMPASPGAASGRIALDAATAVRMAAHGKGNVLLVRHETSPEDIEGMIASSGILTARGGMTSHAAVVARGMGITCVCGCGDLGIDLDSRKVRVGTQVFNEGDWLSIDGTTGSVIAGQVPTLPVGLTGQFEHFLGWADETRRLAVRANADTPRDARVARSFGAQGIGLCRTEHMFFEGDRVLNFRRMILASSDAKRAEALDRLLPEQRADFAAIFEAMHGLPVTVRLLDPPLHEFLPQTAAGFVELSQVTGMSVSAIHAAVDNLHETNPMLGHRGCRLGITYPAIYGMQTRAIVEAAFDCRERGIDARPEIMIPLVGTAAELDAVASHVRAVVRFVQAERGLDEDSNAFEIGTMIEVPRACVTAHEIAGVASFFSFGTNDLTQMTYGFSRDDAGVFLPVYLQRGILPADPFQTIDTNGVGGLMATAVERGRSTRPDLKLGVCGEHGGDPASIEFCHSLGLDYVSCSPYRVPIARLAAAQAAVRATSEAHGAGPSGRSTRVQVEPRPLEPLLR